MAIWIFRVKLKKASQAACLADGGLKKKLKSAVERRQKAVVVFVEVYSCRAVIVFFQLGGTDADDAVKRVVLLAQFNGRWLKRFFTALVQNRIVGVFRIH
jgi:hypothetical protein